MMDECNTKKLPLFTDVMLQKSLVILTGTLSQEVTDIHLCLERGLKIKTGDNITDKVHTDRFYFLQGAFYHL